MHSAPPTISQRPPSDPFLARVVDVGFGYTKFSKGHIGADWALQCDAIPSLAPAGAFDNQLSAGALSRLQVVPVEVEGQVFSVGPDALQAAPGSFRRILDESFFTSPQYLALMRGALHYMALPRDQPIDCLVVGLPLNIYRNVDLRNYIVKKFQGMHQLPDMGDPHRATKAHVREVHVLPQAMGALISQAQANNGLGKLDQETHLVVDVGFGTLLWMVSQGTKPMAARCGETMGGISTLLQSIANDIGVGLNNNPAVLDRIDRALRDPSYELKIKGKVVDMAPHRNKVQAVITEHVGAMSRSLGSFADIDNIYVCGGGGAHYLPLLEAAFKGYKIMCDPEKARFENVRGFQIVAEKRALHQAEQRLAAA